MFIMFFFLSPRFSFKKQLECYGNAKLNVSKPGDDTIRKYSPTTLPSVFPQRIVVGFPVFLLPQKPFSHGHQSFQVNLAYIIIFLIERSYRYLGKVAWRMIAAAKSSTPLPSRSMVYMAISGPFLSLLTLLECRQWIWKSPKQMTSNGIGSAWSHFHYGFFFFWKTAWLPRECKAERF